VEVPLPTPTVTLTEASFTQAVNKLIFFRGISYSVLEMADVRTGFAEVVQVANTETGDESNNPTDGTDVIPQAAAGLWMQNRLFVAHSRDLIAASDYLNYTRYSPTRADFRINQGSADQLVAVYKYGSAGLIAFKEQTIHQVGNVYGNLSLIRQEVLTTEFGLVARKAVVGVGDDVWFLSQRGVTSIGQILDNKMKATRRTLSDPLIETMKRINWKYAANATATYFDGKFLLAVPLDDAKVTNNSGTYTGVNNAILVWDTNNDAWYGTHTGASIMVKDWLQFTWDGKRRLGYLSDDGMLMLYEYAFDDWVRPDGGGNTRAEIPHRMVTRGYTFAPNDSSPEERRAAASSLKRFTRVSVILNTWKPTYSIAAQVEGVNEETAMATNETRDRTEWVRPFDRQAWDESNVNDDHGDPYRKDYSVDMGSGGTPILLGSGVNLQQHQEGPLVKKLNAQGRYCQLVIEATTGRVEVKSVGIEGRAGTRRNGILI
jgi:hypothetical protein